MGQPLSSAEPLLARLWRFARALMVGGAATVGDFTVLTILVRLAGVNPAWARAPALLTGACIQFLGNRTFTFRAQAGRLSRQARLFIAFEAMTLLLNWSLYQGLLKLLPQVAPELLSFAGTFLVFITFNYPVRKNVIFVLGAGGFSWTGRPAESIMRRARRTREPERETQGSGLAGEAVAPRRR